MFAAGLILTACSDKAALEKIKQLEAQNKALQTQFETEQKKRLALEQSVAELQRQLADEAKQALEQQSVGRWNAAIDQILVKLERVRNEDKAFSSARLVGEYTAEETRLKTIAREQEALARTLVYELKAQKFQNTEKLDKLVEDFITDYTHYISYYRVSCQLVQAFGKATDDIRKKENQYLKDYNEKLAEIRAMKKKE